MAQLRDAKTSELLAEGNPSELLLVADSIGHDQFLWDDVGWDERAECPVLDVDAVRDATNARLDHLDESDGRAERKRRDELGTKACREVRLIIKAARDPDIPTPPPVRL